MIFEGISKVNKVLQKNAVKTAFFCALFGYLIGIQSQANGAMTVATHSIPIQTVYFLQSSYLGVTSQNLIQKIGFSGRTQWAFSPDTAKIHGLQTTFNRFGLINQNGEIDTYDAQFGTHYWKSSIQNIRIFKLGYPTIFALSNNQKWVYLIDFYTGYTLNQIAFPHHVGAVKDIQLLDSGDSLWITPTHQLILTADMKWKIKKTTQIPVSQNDGHLNWDGALLIDSTQTPRFAMSRNAQRVRYNGSLITIKPRVNLRDSTWIIDQNLIIEIVPNFNLIRIYSHPSLSLILEWKSPEPDEIWTEIWYDNQLLAIRNQANILSLWNGKTQTFIGATPYPFTHTDLIGMNAVSDVISLVTHTQTAFALIRK